MKPTFYPTPRPSYSNVSIEEVISTWVIQTRPLIEDFNNGVFLEDIEQAIEHFELYME